MKQIILTTLALTAIGFRMFAADAEPGFQAIFNGQDLTGWDGNRTLWSVKDGAIVGRTTVEHPTKGNTFLVWTNGPVADFELRFSYRITPNNDQGFANSGVQYRSKILDPANWVVGGYQADFEAGNTYSGILYEERMRGILAERGQKVVLREVDGKTVKDVVGTVGNSADIQAVIKKEDWNDYVIIAQGNHLQHFINGRLTVDVKDETGAPAAKSGVLAFQLHAGPPMTVEFKNVRLKALSSPAQSSRENAERADGVWEVAAMEANGEAMTTEASEGLKLTVSGEKYSVNKDGEIDRGSFTVDTTKSPQQMDVRPELGPAAGKMILAIYELNGDTMRVCYQIQPGLERPKEFKTMPDSGFVLINYKRAKP
jgi:uncharacterized protein (TIGR03067 family)